MSAHQPVHFHSVPDPAREHVLYLCGGRSFYAEHLGPKIAGVARCWRELGFEVSHVCGGDLGHVTASSAHRGAPAFGAQAHHAAWYRKNALLQPFRNSVSEWRDMRHDRLVLRHIAELAAGNPPRLVWERSARLHKAGLDLARRMDVPYVLEWKDHLIDYERSLFRQRALGVEAEKEREADWIVVESEVLKRQLVQSGRPQESVLVAHNAVDSAAFAPDPARRARFRQGLGMAGDCLLIGYLGSYAFYHDTPRLIEAAGLVRDRLRGRAKLVLVGAGRDRPACEALARDLELGDGVVFCEPVHAEEVPGVLAGLDIAVLPGSTDIICPIKVQEYMAAALPVVVPDFACNREVVAPGVSGLLFKPGDAGDLAGKLIQLVDDAEGLNRLGKAAQQVAAERFSWEATWGRALLRVLEAERTA